MKMLGSWQFRLAAGVYCAGWILGFALPPAPAGPAVLSVAPHPSFLESYWTILSTNLGVIAVVVASGLPTLGTLSTILVGFNGFLFGSAWRAGLAHAPVESVAFATMLHGVPEIISLVVAGYIALRLASALVGMFRRDPKPGATGVWQHLLRVSTLVGVLAITAALVEAVVGTWMLRA
jgi:uncharacterized membrane protein SpoIIM required for sporulation